MSNRNITPRMEAHSRLIGYLDGSGGDMNALFDALDSAREAGFDVSDQREMAERADSAYDKAFEEAEEGPGANVSVVVDQATVAKNAMEELTETLDPVASQFYLSRDIDSGVYETLGTWADYVYRESVAIQVLAEDWANLER